MEVKKGALNVTEHFINATMDRIETDQSFEARALEYNAKSVYRLAFAHLAGSLSQIESDNDKKPAKIIEAAERIAAAYIEFCSEEEVRAFLPPQAQASGIAGELAYKGAPILARFCSP